MLRNGDCCLTIAERVRRVTSGRTAPLIFDLSRAELTETVFSTRLISIALLVFYGIPSAIGPHWHHHHHGDHQHGGHRHGDGSCCAHSGCQTVEQDSAAKQDAHHDCDCQSHSVNADSHQHDTSALATGALAEKAAREQSALGSHANYVAISQDGPCSICDFYSSAQSQKQASVQLTDAALVASLETHVTVRLSTATLCQRARGPPSDLARIS